MVPSVSKEKGQWVRPTGLKMRLRHTVSNLTLSACLDLLGLSAGILILANSSDRSGIERFCFFLVLVFY